MDIKCDGGGAPKIRRRRNWSVDDFDSMEIRVGRDLRSNVNGCCRWLTRLSGFTLPESHLYIGYDTIEEFNVDSKAECDRLKSI